MKRENLVIVRAGDQSLHPQWLAGHGDRNWDIVVNYYGDALNPYEKSDLPLIRSKGPKWPALHDLLEAHPMFLADYDYVWLPDDDLLATKQSINLLFALCKQYRLEVAQPALTWNSFYSHITTLRNPWTLIRFTNYVEVMAPCFATGMLAKALPLFKSTLSGWGLDFVWPKLASHPDTGIAIIDAVTVCHTRPVGGPNYNILKKNGISPWDELRAFCREHGLDEKPTIATHKAVRRDGTLIAAARQQRRFALKSASGYLSALPHTPNRRRMIRRIVGMTWKGINNIPDRVSESGSGS
jgi:hypothetical protein